MQSDISIISNRSVVIIIALWLCVALPISWLGFGSDDDAWRVGGAADKIWAEKTYHKSRTTGFPMLEILAAPLVVAGGYKLTNLICVTSGVFFILALVSLARMGEFRHPTIVILTLAFMPIILKNATSTMDYVPALALFIWAYVLVQKDRWMLAAVLIGLSVGFRPTSAFFVIPICAYAVAHGKGFLFIVRFLVVSGLCGLLAFSPSLLAYGIPKSPALPGSWSSKVMMGGYYALVLMGILQSAVIGVIFVYMAVRGKLTANMNARKIFHLVTVGVFIGLYLPIAMVIEYLLPIIPSLIILLDGVLSGRVMVLLMMFLMSNHFVQLDMLAGESGMRKISPSVRGGITVLDIQYRIFWMSLREATDAYEPKEPTVLMFGHPCVVMLNTRWSYDEETRLYRKDEGNLYIAKAPSTHDFALLKSRGFRLVVWRHNTAAIINRNKSSWRENSEMPDSLSEFFKFPIRGRVASQVDGPA